MQPKYSNKGQVSRELKQKLVIFVEVVLAFVHVFVDDPQERHRVFWLNLVLGNAIRMDALILKLLEVLLTSSALVEW